METRVAYDRLFVGGAWVPARGEPIELISPVTEEVYAVVPSASEEDVDLAVASARDAFDAGPWPRLPLEERLSILRRLRDLLAANEERIARLITDEMGCPISQSRVSQAANPVRILDAYLDLAPSYPFRVTRQAATGSALVTREPVGVAAAVVPWNVPLGISIQKLVPAVLAGCTVVLKPAPQTPLDGYLLAELVEEAGFPAGVINIVPAERAASEYLVGHKGVDKVSFTGSTGAGRRIASLCGASMKRVTLELGGKSAALVLDDADLDQPSSRCGSAPSATVGRCARSRPGCWCPRVGVTSSCRDWSGWSNPCRSATRTWTPPRSDPSSAQRSGIESRTTSMSAFVRERGWPWGDPGQAPRSAGGSSNRRSSTRLNRTW